VARPASPERLDALLVRLGLAASRARARELIEGGAVEVDRLPATHPDARVRPDREIRLAREDHPWVGRGALKLIGALDALGVDPSGAVAADLGASTGGFTQVLLARGAERVYAVDVGRGQLAWVLRQDPRVVTMEGVNARHLQALPEPVDLVVGDLSFISLGLILPVISRILREGGQAVVLVKPQFEVGRGAVGRGGRVRSEADREAAIAAVRSEAERAGLAVIGGVDSEVAGAKAGNVEHFLHLRRGGPAGRPADPPPGLDEDPTASGTP
jgi:23S rRNA (cytidine1920-2'-O)/16S rRNA (cytidine1409-2'-O)-methyltransferase